MKYNCSIKLSGNWLKLWRRNPNGPIHWTFIIWVWQVLDIPSHRVPNKRVLPNSCWRCRLRMPTLLSKRSLICLPLNLTFPLLLLLLLLDFFLLLLAAAIAACYCCYCCLSRHVGRWFRACICIPGARQRGKTTWETHLHLSIELPQYPLDCSNYPWAHHKSIAQAAALTFVLTRNRLEGRCTKNDRGGVRSFFHARKNTLR